MACQQLLRSFLELGDILDQYLNCTVRRCLRTSESRIQEGYEAEDAATCLGDG